MKLHVDTSFLIDWRRDTPRIVSLRDEILAGLHEVTYDPICETEFLSAFRRTRRHDAIMYALSVLAMRVDITPGIAELAAQWLAPMDQQKRRAHFADAIIAACATAVGATLVTGNGRLARVFPAVRVTVY